MPKTIFNNLRALFLAQVGLALVLGGIVAAIWGVSLGASFVVGATLMLANLGLIAWSSWRLLTKKSIAWTVMIIVIKYAVLLGSIVFFARTDWFSSLGAGLGVASFLIAALIAALLNQKEDEDLGSSSL